MAVPEAQVRLVPASAAYTQHDLGIQKPVVRKCTNDGCAAADRRDMECHASAPADIEEPPCAGTVNCKG